MKLTHPSRAAELKEEIKEQALKVLIADIQRMVKESSTFILMSGFRSDRCMKGVM